MKTRALSCLLAFAILLLAGCGLIYDRSESVTADGQTNVVYSPRPGVTDGLGTAKQVARFLPSPWGEIATGILGVTTTILGVVAKRKSTLVRAMVIGVEAANHAPVKAAIQQIAHAAGVERGLNRVVKRVTKARAKATINHQPSTSPGTGMGSKE
jgi:hypothetical protein